jgi:hypothetical protein
LDNSEKIILDLCGGTGSWSRPYKDAGYDVRLITLPDQDVRYYHPPKHVYGILAAPPCTDFCISGVRWWAEKDRTKGLLEALSVVAACLRIIEKAKPHFWALENPVGRLPRYIGEYKYTFQPYEYGDPWTKRTCIWGDHNIPEKHRVEPVGCIVNSHGNNRPVNLVDHFPSLVSSGSGYKRGKKELPVKERNYPSFTGGTPSGKMGIVDHPDILKERFPDGIPANWVHNHVGPGKDRAMLRSITPPGFARAFYEANK